MTFDVKPLLRGEVNCIKLDYTLPVELAGVRFEEDARVVGEIIDRAGYMRLSLKLSVPYSTECARCLDEVRGFFEEDFERTVVTKGSVSAEKLDEDIDEYAVVNDNGELDVDEEVAETIAASKNILKRMRETTEADRERDAGLDMMVGYGYDFRDEGEQVADFLNTR